MRQATRHMMRYLRAVVISAAVVLLVLFFLATWFVFHDPYVEFSDTGAAPDGDTVRTPRGPAVRMVRLPRRKRGQTLHSYGSHRASGAAS
jgi:hypothetical protein